MKSHIFCRLFQAVKTHWFIFNFLLLLSPLQMAWSNPLLGMQNNDGRIDILLYDIGTSSTWAAFGLGTGTFSFAFNQALRHRFVRENIFLELDADLF